jgi:hypothetical protein
MHPLHGGLAGAIDYAGLFPPAGLDLERALGNHRRYARGRERWLLGRFVVPLSSLDALDALLGPDEGPDAPPAWSLSIIAPLASLEAAARHVERFNRKHAPAAAILAVETSGATAADVERLAGAFPMSVERYLELPAQGEVPGELLDAIRRTGCYAKVRTGGVTADRFPDAGTLARLLGSLVAAGVTGKATAGLHHPLRGHYRLTYEAATDSADMHGFINLLVSATLLHAGHADAATAASVLTETDPAAFELGDDSVAWRGHRVTSGELIAARAGLLRSFGSCSFEEPVAELRRLGWWPSAQAARSGS